MTHSSPRAPDARVLLLAGGLGTRLKPITDTVPKCLVPIASRPLLDYWLDLFGEAGLREIRINTHHLPEAVRQYMGAVNRAGRFHISEAYEPTLLGSAGTVAANRDLADRIRDVLIVYADNLSDVDLRAMLAFHHAHGDPMTMMLFRAPRPENCGIATIDADKRVVRFVEKPKAPESDLANAGLYVLTADAYREVADMRAFDFGFDVLPRFVGRMRGWPWEGYHLDIGTHEALRRAEGDIANMRRAGSTIDYHAIFDQLTADPRYQANLDWGAARPGHPEGSVRAHIAEIEQNLEMLRPKLRDGDYWKLKLLIHTHDSFKAVSQPGVPISDPKSHASLARAFLAEYCSDADLLAMVQYHDEPFALYRQFQSKGKYNQERFDALTRAIRDWNLFLTFNIIDGCTVGKSREPLRWLFREAAGKVTTEVSAADIVE